MDKIELLDLIAKGESSFVEFKADTSDIKAETIAEYVVSFANAKGGKLLLEELRRLFQSSGLVHFEATPVSRSKLQDLNEKLLIEYFKRVRGIEYDEKNEDAYISKKADWEKLLLDNQLLSDELGTVNCTLAGLLLFGRKDRIKLLVPQSGVSAVEYDNSNADVAGIYRKEINGSLLSLRSDAGEIIEHGIIDLSVDFILRARSKEKIEGVQRVVEYIYPPEVLREAIVNALAHRDYTIGGTNIGMWLFPDRLEIESPGTLPNTITIERMKNGARYHRNQMLVNYLRDMNFIEGSGRGVSRKIIRGMLKHNGKEPMFEIRGESLRLTLFA
ncbi:MAG: hypothetical protein HQK79_18345 [Desulfobacterales bacterium]|nr:hypothetical protein [Desulfobacterales bacterium]MBF0395215.1 hypothetical protein [Desulfobacterales bacterium]